MKALIESIQNDPLLKAKLQMLAMAEEYGSVTEACSRAGFSRDTFYRVKQAFETFGIEGLVHKSKGRINLKNRVPAEVEARVVELARENPSSGKLKLAKVLAAEGIDLSPAGVRIVLIRNGLWHRTVNTRLAAEHAMALSTVFE